MTNLEKRKQDLQETALNMEYCSNGGIIYQIIKDGSLDKVISKLDNERVDLESTSIVKKGYYTADEQFIDLMNNFIHVFNRDFAIMGSGVKFLIEELLKNETPEFLLSKSYWGDNDNIAYFRSQIYQFVIYGFYNNINTLYDRYEYFFKKHGIKKNMNFQKQKVVEKLYQFLKDLCWCNYDTYGVYFLFIDINVYNQGMKEQYKNITEDNMFEHYYTHWDWMIEKYNKRIECVKNFLKI